MTNFFDTAAGMYLVNGLISAGAVYITSFLHKSKQKVEEKVSTILPTEDAVKVNDFLDTVERLTNAAVQSTNALVVSGLKQSNLFTPETASAVKQSVIAEVLKNLGPLKDKGAALVGPLENIIIQYIEQKVTEAKIPAKQG